MKKLLILMEHRNYFLIFFLMNLLLFTSSNNGKFLSKLGKKQIDLDNVNKLSKRQLQTDNYILIKFNRDCNYPKGFENDWRMNISYIINRENNANLTSIQELIIHKEYGIEIHFNLDLTDLFSFFSKYEDNNMEYLMSVDFSNFYSSLITDISYMFAGCSS